MKLPDIPFIRDLNGQSNLLYTLYKNVQNTCFFYHTHTIPTFFLYITLHKKGNKNV